MIYIAVFALSSFIFWKAEKDKDKYKKKMLVFLGFILPVILAGLRADSVGTDVEVYGKWAYNQAILTDSFKIYYQARTESILGDIGYYFLTYVSAKIFPNYHIGLFIYSMIIQLFLYLGLKKYHRIFNTPVWLGMLLYYVTLYNYSLNLLRQSIAIVIIFYGSAYIFEKKYWKFILFLILATLFHSSAFIAVVMLPMYALLKHGGNNSLKKQFFRGSIFVIGLMFVLYEISNILQTLVTMGIVRSNYSSYLNGGAFTESAGNNISIIGLLPHILIIMLIILMFKRLDKRQKEPLLFFMFSVIILITDFAPLFAQYAERIGLYFVPLQNVILCNERDCFAHKSKKYWYLLLIMMLGLFWIRSMVIFKYGQTVPYEFYWN